MAYCSCRSCHPVSSKKKREQQLIVRFSTAQSYHHLIIQMQSLKLCVWVIFIFRQFHKEDNWHRAFYLHLRREMDEYDAAKRRLRLVKNTTEYEEDLYDEVI